MSPLILSADVAAFSAEVRAVRASLRVAQIDASWEAVRGDEGAELLLRAIAADRADDTPTLVAIFDRAEEIDNAQPFGPRIVDQLHALTRWVDAA